MVFSGRYECSSDYHVRRRTTWWKKGSGSSRIYTYYRSFSHLPGYGFYWISPGIRNHAIDAPGGRTILPALKGKKLSKRDLFFEHQTSCGIISGDWKLVRLMVSSRGNCLTCYKIRLNRTIYLPVTRIEWKHWKKSGINGQKNNRYFLLNTDHGLSVSIIINPYILINPERIYDPNRYFRPWRCVENNRKFTDLIIISMLICEICGSGL